MTNPVNILVLEDDALIAMALADDLYGIGTAITVATVDDALRELATRDIHFAVVDYHLGQMNAEPVMEALKDRNLPFVICTGSTPALEDGALDGMIQLAKPYLTDDLRRIAVAGIGSPGDDDDFAGRPRSTIFRAADWGVHEQPETP